MNHISMIIMPQINTHFLIYMYFKLAMLMAYESRYTTRPIHGLRCQATARIDVWETARPQCVWRCLRMKTCRYINHKSDIGRCELGLGQCESLQQAAGYVVNAFGPPRHGCILWGSRQNSGWVPIQEKNGEIYVARIVYGDAVVIGKWNTGSELFRANMEGIKVGPINGIESDIEFLFKDADCPLAWMPYTAGEPLPFGSVTGGHLADGSVTYVVKITIPDDVAFGYYDSNSALAYYKSHGLYVATSMDILVLI